VGTTGLEPTASAATGYVPEAIAGNSTALIA